ncbi:MAG: alkaline phosphatase family protein, partial [Solirubrobacterales bacterium]|nr:alkaline phosphatase family protein [Solirubrobacterales bacterium]
MVKLRIVAIAALAFGAAVVVGPPVGPSPAAAQQASVGDDPTKPLVYVFSLDAQDGAKAIDDGEAPFLASLVRGEQGARATYYKQSRGIMVSETNPNHTAMATGAYGKSSGISGNTFAVYDQAAKQNCPNEGGSTEPGRPMITSGESSTCLQAESFFAALKRLSPETVTAGIFGKPKLGRIFATKRIDPAVYDADHLWAPCEQASDDPPYCRNVLIDPVQRYTDDNIVMDEIIRTVDEGVPADGALRRPNLTFVNFPDIDQTGHVTGAGPAYTTQIGRTDQQLRRFVEHQKEKGLWGRTVVFFTSDHSMDSTTPTPGRGLQSAFGDDAGAVEIVLNGSVDMVYLKDRDRPDRDALLARLRQKALATGFADEALYRLPNAADGGVANTLDGVHPGWNIAGERTGDLFVTSKPGVAFGDGVPGELNPLPGNHGAPTTLDTTLAIVSGGGQVVQQTIDGLLGPRFDDT